MDFGFESVLTSLPPFHPQTQDNLDESMMAAKQGVSVMHELYAIHVYIMHMLCNKYQVKYTSKVQHTSFQPYSSHTRIQWRVSLPRIFFLGFNINRGY